MSIVATANDVSQVPPKMLRVGRWDQLLFIDLPTREERELILGHSGGQLPAVARGIRHRTIGQGHRVIHGLGNRAGLHRGTLPITRVLRTGSIAGRCRIRLEQDVRFFSRWPFTLLLAVMTIGLSIVGYYALLPKAEWSDPLEWLSNTVSFFKMSWQWRLATPAPWPLHVARVTGAFFTLSALAEVWMAFFGEQVKRLRLSCWKGHVVICGLGRKGLQLAHEFRRRKTRVVITDIKPDEDDVRFCRWHNILVETGDASKETTLYAVGADRARYVFAVCRDDHTNLEIAMETLARFREAQRNTKLDCYVHLVNLPLRVLLQRHELLKTRPKGFELHFFNIYQNAARKLFADYPPDRSVGRSDKRVHLIIVGMTRLGEAVITQAARIGHYRDLRPVRFTVVDENAEADSEEYVARHPSLKAVCEIRFLSARLTEPRFINFEFLDDGAGESRAVVLCLEQDEANVAVALTLAERTQAALPLLTNVSERRGLAKLLAASKEELARKGIRTFGTVEEVCGWDLVRNGELDVLAKTFAAFYHQRHGGGDKPDRPDLGKELGQLNRAAIDRIWADLDEDLRQSNRAAADHIDVKLRAIGCRRAKGKTPGAPFAFAPEEVELLARMEHLRWRADRLLNGWVLGVHRDNQRKIHPDLGFWEDLNDKTRDKDREQVRDIPAVLEQLGEFITRGQDPL